jgi:hypothetical protein
MQLHLLSQALFTHAALIPVGSAFTSPTSGTIAPETWPGSADTIWDDNEHKLGTLENFKFAPTANESVIRTGIPGRLRDKDVHEVGAEFKATCDFVEMSSTALSLLFGGWIATGLGAPLAATTSFTPMKGDMIRKGIFAFAAYRNDDVLFLSGNLWAAIKLTNMEPMSGANTIKGSFDIRFLWSSLNAIECPAEP